MKLRVAQVPLTRLSMIPFDRCSIVMSFGLRAEFLHLFNKDIISSTVNSVFKVVVWWPLLLPNDE